MNSIERELERTGYDNWKLSSRDEELERDRRRTGRGGRWGTVEYEYIVDKLDRCPCCEDDILEDDMWTEDENGMMYHFQCFNRKIKVEEEERINGR